MIRLLQTLLFATFLMMSSVQAQAQSDWQVLPVDPQRDAIIGVEDAPHTLIFYFSPACWHCFKLFQGSLTDSLLTQLNAREVRVVFRLFPPIVSPPPQGTVAEQTISQDDGLGVSFHLARQLTCVQRRKGGPEFMKAFGMLRQAIIDNAENEGQLDSWPYFSNDQIRAVATQFNDTNGMSAEDIAGCDTDEINSYIQEISRNVIEGGHTSAPLAFINGEQINLGFNHERAVGDALAQFSATPAMCQNRMMAQRLEILMDTFVNADDVPRIVGCVDDRAACPNLQLSENAWMRVADDWQSLEGVCP